MTALSGPRVPTRKEGNRSTAPMKGSTKIWNGAIVVMDSGLAVPGKTATGLVVLGIATDTVDNTGGDGAAKVTAERGCFKFANSTSTDAIAGSEIGKDCYLVDDQTVAKTNGSSTRSVAGKVIDVDSDGVWVALG
ncbi:MAG: hypothetical protein M9955_15645 [Rhizobiaceae bacterium]|nr:hypothetical protein [Rhizobiaceae bacterium]